MQSTDIIYIQIIRVFYLIRNQEEMGEIDKKKLIF